MKKKEEEDNRNKKKLKKRKNETKNERNEMSIYSENAIKQAAAEKNFIAPKIEISKPQNQSAR